MESNEYNSLNISSPQCGKKSFHIDKIKKCKINKNQQINNFPLYINDYLFPKHKSKPKNKYNFYHLINFQLQKYNSTPEQKNIMIINDMINAKSNHFLAAFKDFLITDYIDEFLKRYFTFDESEELIPKFHLYYQNYLNFFCKGLFLDFKANKILQDKDFFLISKRIKFYRIMESFKLNYIIIIIMALIMPEKEKKGILVIVSLARVMKIKIFLKLIKLNLYLVKV